MVANTIFDYGVHAGIYRAVQTAQRCVNVILLRRGESTIRMDGKYGDKTHAAIASIGPLQDMFCLYYLCDNATHYRDIILNRHDQARFAKGWANRIAEKLARVLNRWNSPD